MRWFAAAALAVGATFLSGCVVLGYLNADPPGYEVGLQIEDVLREAEDLGTTVVNLDHVIDGDWPQAVIVCGGTRAELHETLGFEWNGINPERAGLLSAVLFATADSVDTYFQAGLDDAWVNHWYFTLCSTVQDDPEGETFELQFSLPRSESRVPFTFYRDDPFSYWYVAREALPELSSN